jgi:hypothetical protein
VHDAQKTKRQNDGSALKKSLISFGSSAAGILYLTSPVPESSSLCNQALLLAETHARISSGVLVLSATRGSHRARARKSWIDHRPASGQTWPPTWLRQAVTNATKWTIPALQLCQEPQKKEVSEQPRHSKVTTLGWLINTEELIHDK